MSTLINLKIGFLSRNVDELNSGKPIMDYYYHTQKWMAFGDFSAYTTANLSN